MKTSEQIASELAELVQRHYYSEDFELQAALRAYAEALGADDRQRLRYVVGRRMADSDSLVDVLLCTVFDVPESTPSLVRALHRQTGTSQMSRALIAALGRYGGPEAFRAVERFMDSDQDREALAALARMDFGKALPYMLRCLAKEHFFDVALHILHDRKKAVGFQAMVAELRSGGALASPASRDRLRCALTAKQGDFNPFSGQELRNLLAAIDYVE